MASQMESDEAFARRLQAEELGGGNSSMPLMYQNAIANSPARGSGGTFQDGADGRAQVNSLLERHVVGERGDGPQERANMNRMMANGLMERHVVGGGANAQNGNGANNNPGGIDDLEQARNNLAQQRANEIRGQKVSLGAILIVSIPQIIAAISILSQEWENKTGCDAEHISRWYWWAGASAVRMFFYCINVAYIVIGREWLEEHPRYVNHASIIFRAMTITLYCRCIRKPWSSSIMLYNNK